MTPVDGPVPHASCIDRVVSNTTLPPRPTAWLRICPTGSVPCCCALSATLPTGEQEDTAPESRVMTTAAAPGANGTLTHPAANAEIVPAITILAFIFINGFPS